MEGYESWEDSMLVKFSEFLGFSIVGFRPQIIDHAADVEKLE